MNIEALFLGPKAENRQWFKKMVKELLEEHIHWRRNFHPEDKASITNEDQRKPDYLNTLQKTENVLFELSGMLKARALPAHSPRYAGHMLTDLLMPAHLAYLATVLYNPNNVCWEAAPVTTALEVEVGIAIGVMLGFDKSKCYGHITSGGTVANLECLWVARNVRSMPFALKHVYPDRLGHATEKELQNMTLDEILDFVEKDPSKIEEVKAFSVRGVGIRSGNLNFGKVFVPRTKHYSWNKAMDVLGMGQNNLVYVDVDIKFRLDINDLSKKVLQAIHDGHPILAVVGVVGSTEEGAVDPINEIIALRKRVYKEHKVWFWVHVDGAYGGYASSIFRDVDHSLLPRDRLVEKLHDLKIIDKKLGWPEKEVYNAFAAIGKADSVTIDPHKLGYVPYQAGAMVVRDKRVQPLLSYFATYIFEVTGPEDSGSGIPLGSYILEGSKAGATAAAVWAAHQVVPGNIEGYGRIIGESFEGCNLLYHKLQNFRWESNETPKRSFVILTMNKPDTNLLIYVVNQEGNRSLKKLNAITQQIRDATSPKGLRGTFTYNFMLSSTSLTHEEYGECPKAILERLGLDVAEWDQLHTVSVLRSTLMSPYTTTDFTEVDYGDVVLDGLKKVLTYLVETNRI